MARIARVVVPGVPHHVTQRGNRRMDVFFNDEDRAAYLELLREFGEKHGVEYWGYCLMSNHVHLIAVPKTPESLALGIGWAHNAYTRRVNFREGWRGYLWQGRFFSSPLDEHHAEVALRYVELNPVRAGLARQADDWPWSSAVAHLGGKPDGLTSPAPFMRSPGGWRELLREGVAQDEMDALRERTRTGRPSGSTAFTEQLERLLKRALARKKPGPAPKTKRARTRGQPAGKRGMHR